MFELNWKSFNNGHPTKKKHKKNHQNQKLFDIFFVFNQFNAL